MAKKKTPDPDKAALLAYDYAAFCVLDWCDNASFAVPPALAVRLDLLRAARAEGGSLLAPPMTREHVPLKTIGDEK